MLYLHIFQYLVFFWSFFLFLDFNFFFLPYTILLKLEYFAIQEIISFCKNYIMCKKNPS